MSAYGAATSSQSFRIKHIILIRATIFYSLQQLCL